VSDVRVREVVGTMQVMDAEALLSGPLLQKIVAAVLQALQAERQDEQRRKRDTHIGGACCDACEGDGR
jgi:hypothetical protein